MIRYILDRMNGYYETVTETTSFLAEYLIKALFAILQLLLDILIIVSLPIWILPFCIIEIWRK